MLDTIIQGLKLANSKIIPSIIEDSDELKNTYSFLVDVYKNCTLNNSNNLDYDLYSCSFCGIKNILNYIIDYEKTLSLSKTSQKRFIEYIIEIVDKCFPIISTSSYSFKKIALNNEENDFLNPNQAYLYKKSIYINLISLCLTFSNLNLTYKIINNYDLYFEYDDKKTIYNDIAKFFIDKYSNNNLEEILQNCSKEILWKISSDINTFNKSYNTNDNIFFFSQIFFKGLTYFANIIRPQLNNNLKAFLKYNFGDDSNYNKLVSILNKYNDAYIRKQTEIAENEHDAEILKSLIFKHYKAFFTPIDDMSAFLYYETNNNHKKHFLNESSKWLYINSFAYELTSGFVLHRDFFDDSDFYNTLFNGQDKIIISKFNYSLFILNNLVNKTASLLLDNKCDKLSMEYKELLNNNEKKEQIICDYLLSAFEIDNTLLSSLKDDNGARFNCRQDAVNACYLKIKNNIKLTNYLASGIINLNSFKNIAITNEADYTFLVISMIKCVERYLKEILVQYFPNEIYKTTTHNGRIFAERIILDFANNDYILSAYDLSHPLPLGCTNEHYKHATLECAPSYYALKYIFQNQRNNIHLTKSLYDTNNPYKDANNCIMLREENLLFANNDFQINWISKIRNGYLHIDPINSIEEAFTNSKQTAKYILLLANNLPPLLR